MFRKNKKLSIFSISLLSLAALSVQASPIDETHMVVAPKCLLKQTSDNLKTIASKNALVLLQTNDAGIEELVTAKTLNKCGGFMDVTYAWQQFSTKNLSQKGKAALFLSKYAQQTAFTDEKDNKNASVYTIKYQDQTNEMIKKINPQNMWNDLTTLSSYDDRYYRSDNGLKAANWIKTQIETIAKNAGHDDVTVYTVATGTYKQPSVVAKIGKSDAAGIVIGGHMDTLSSSYSKKPGADDDGTGTVTVLEVGRALLESDKHFKKPIYLIWYAAEEVGLVGSEYVVADFKKKKIPVDAVLQLDMTGYSYKNERTLWLINDYVNSDLTKYLKTLVDTYVKQPVDFTRCGYACSDHASWNHEGFKACMPFEAAMGHDNPDIHSSRDTMEKLSLDHMTDFAKLAVAFAVELAEPVAKNQE